MHNDFESESSSAEHIPVLAKTLTGQINLPQDAVMVDATIGHGGHSFLFGKTLGPEGVIIGMDVDENSIARARLKLEGLDCKVKFIRENFSRISEAVSSAGFEKVDFILADLGVCSAQLVNTDRGLSFQSNMPLDMRLDNRLGQTAEKVVNNLDEKSLADIIYQYGEDRASRRIARFIVEYRNHQAIKSTGQLASIVCKALGKSGPGRGSKIHPATRTFQALRIFVNDELKNLEKLLNSAPKLLKAGGYFAIISFHSLEDRLVKQSFKSNKASDIYRILTKKPIIPSKEEIAENPRARSSKLRIAQKL